MTEPQTTDRDLFGAVARVAGLVASDSFPTGDRAALRRMAPGQPPPLVFCRFALAHLREGWEHRLDDWITLVAGIAIMAPHAFSRDVGLGRALAEARYSEARLERLLASAGETRRVLLLRAARMLAAKTTPFNWTDAARLLLTRDPEKLRQLHMAIARDFYRTLDQTQAA